MGRSLLALCGDSVRREMPTNCSALAFFFSFCYSFGVERLCAGTTFTDCTEEAKTKDNSHISDTWKIKPVL